MLALGNDHGPADAELDVPAASRHAHNGSQRIMSHLKRSLATPAGNHNGSTVILNRWSTGKETLPPPATA
jgi:hypothetical protein